MASILRCQFEKFLLGFEVNHLEGRWVDKVVIDGQQLDWRLKFWRIRKRKVLFVQVVSLSDSFQGFFPYPEDPFSASPFLKVRWPTGVNMIPHGFLGIGADVTEKSSAIANILIGLSFRNPKLFDHKKHSHPGLYFTSSFNCMKQALQRNADRFIFGVQIHFIWMVILTDAIKGRIRNDHVHTSSILAFSINFMAKAWAGEDPFWARSKIPFTYFSFTFEPASLKCFEGNVIPDPSREQQSSEGSTSRITAISSFVNISEA